MTHPSILPHILSSPPVECGANDNQWILTTDCHHEGMHERCQWKHYAELN